MKIVSTCENVAKSRTARQGLQIGLDLLDMDNMGDMDMNELDMDDIDIFG